MSVTREKILELGEQLILTKGYNAFSYQDISSELGIKNAAIHYYFPSKENLGIGIVKTNKLRFEEMIENLNSRQFDEWHQLETFMKIYVKSNREHKLCLIGSLGSDYNTLSESTKNELQKFTEFILDWLSQILNSGREKSIFAFNGEPKERALLILTNMVAGVQLARILDKNDFKSIYQSVLDDLKPESL
jgi:TetR/AcrR family transcriptional regulator, transcriptional repressor for nem operon